ncbi:Serine protease, subtilase family [Granulicella rosea]|uniref:Serine protease, subtilase family n=1 Tax=Granulicella rosea TaxID=474952 RepID=A0A239MIN9_9BACT|nr:FG-GAP-like repeat-containing protein [Granulicella rosea]SNT41972.1 Serine protease, subtilase family [Granulicella rosea]
MVFYSRAVSTLVSCLSPATRPRRATRRLGLFLWAFILSWAPLQAQQLQVLTKHVRAAVSDHRAALYGAMPSERRIRASIVLPLRNQDQLKSLLGRLYDPGSPDYRRFLSVAQFTDQFGPTTDDFQTVVAFARANGLHVGDLPANRLVVPIDGTASQMGAAFHVQMNLYQHPTENRTFYSPDREPSLDLKVPVSHIAGLDDYSVPKHMAIRRPVAATTNGPVTASAQQAAILGSGPGGSYLGSDMRAAYYGGSTLDGNGQTIGILEFGGYSLSDVNASFSNAGQSYQTPIVNVLLDGATGATVGDDGEQTLDIVQAIGMAPGLSQVRVYIGSGPDDANILNSMASENLAKQLSCSWGWRPADPAVDDVFFQEMAAQGQSFFTASGDSGAYDAAINPYFYPADDAYVTAVGGTHLTTASAAGAWVSESVWNSDGDGSGGGLSQDGILIPSWQAGLATSANGGSTTLRNVPDVAMEGDFDNYACQNGACAGDWAGTSFAAPRWAGFMALINQQAVEAGNAPTGGLGFVNPAIYRLAQGANAASDFHDVTVGNNDTYNQPLWYSATAGYDLTTGWGSANGQHLIDDLAGAQIPGFWLSPSLRTIAVNPGATAAANISITPAGGFGGSVNLAITSALPAGVTASFSPNPTTSASVLTLTATGGAPTASQPVTITGTSDQLAASASVTVAVHAPSFALSATPASLGINQGGTGTTTIAVQDLYGFTGSVNLSIAGLPTGVTAAFSNATTSGSSVLTLTVASTAVAGSYSLTVSGVSGSTTASTTIPFSIHGPSFLLATGAPTVNIGQGGSGTAYVYVGDLYGFTGSVNLAASGLPSGVTATFSPNPTTGASYVVFTATSAANIGQSTVTLTGTSGQLSATTTLLLSVFAPSFALYSSGTVGVGIGSSASTYVTVSDLYGFTGAVNLSISGLPSGVTASISPNPTTANANILFTASGSAAIGQSVVTITGTSGAITSTVALNLGVYAPTFTLSNSGLGGLGQGKSVTSNIYVNNQYGFAGQVNLSVSGLPSGVTASFSPNPTTGTSLLTLTASSSTPVGQSVITVTGTSGSISTSTTLQLGVYAPTFTLSSSGAVSIGQGKTASAYVYVYDQYGFNGLVNFSVSGLPSGVTASFSPNPTSSSTTVAFTASSAASVGQSTVTITGVSGSVSVSTTLNLAIYLPTFTLEAPTAINIGQGNSVASSISIYSEYGFNSNVALSVSGLPAGLTALWTPNPTASSSSLILAATGTLKTGTYNLTIAGVSGSQTATATVAVTVYAPTFSLSAYSVSLGQGSTATTYVYLSTLYGFNGQVNLSVSGLPSGVTASFATNPITYSSALVLSATSAAAVGQYTLTVTGTSGSQTVTTPVTLTIYAPTFTISGGGSVTLGQGSSSVAYFYVSPQYGFSGNVTFSVAGLPSGVTAVFSPNPTTSSSTLTVTASGSAPSGVYTLTVTGTSGSLSSATTFTVTIAAPSFTLYNYSNVSLGQGSSGTAYVYVTPANGFTGNVTLSVAGLPSGVTASFSPNATTSSSMLTLTAGSSAAIGQYNLTVTGTSGSLSATTTIPLTIVAPSFTISSSNIGIGQGSTAYEYLYVNSTSGFAGSVTFSVAGLPSGVTGTFSTNPTTYSTSLNLSVAASVPAGTSTVTVTGVSGSLSASSSFQLTIYPPTFSLYDSNPTLTLNQGGSASNYIYVEAQYGFNGAVTFTANGLPSGVTASFSPNPSTSSTNLVLTATSAAAIGSSTITITGVSGTGSASVPITLTVDAPSFTLTATPATALLTPGSSQSTTLTAVAQNGFTGAVTYTASGLPAGVTASFTPNPTTGASILTLTASPTAAPATGMVNVTGVSGSLSATTAIAVTVGATPVSTSTTLALTPAGATVASGTLVTATASVNAGSTPLTTGLVNLCDTTATTCDAAHLVGSAQIVSAGTATFAFIPGPGAHRYKAFFAGTRSKAASTSAVANLAVTASLASTTTIAQSGSAGKYTLTATVTGQGPLAPTGNVSYLDATDGNYAFASATLGAGTATFSTATPQTTVAGTQPEAVATGDFNGDGVLDLVSVNTGSNNLTVLLGNGDGAFRSAATLPTGSGPDSIATGDFNGDGRLDLAVASSNSSGVNVYLGNGDGTFTISSLSPQTGSNPVNMAVGDFNGDGIADLVVTTGNYSAPITILLGNGDGSFTPTASTPALGSNARGIAIGDFNRDGIQDLAITNGNGLSILLGVGDGSFGTAATISSIYYPTAVVAGDLNGDGKLDLVVSSQYYTNGTVLLGNGDGTFTIGSSPATGSYALSLVLGDFNGDGKTDLAAGNEYGSTGAILLGNGDGTFAASIPVATGSSPYALVAGDFNGDGLRDLAFANSSGGSLTIVTSQLTQQATAVATSVAPLGQGQHAAAASYAGDTVYAGSVSPTTLLAASAGAPTVSLHLSSASITEAQPLTVTITVSGGSANPVPTGSVTLTGGGATTPAVALSGGSAAVTLPAGTFPVGADLIYASYTPDAASSSLYTSASGSSGVTVGKATPVLSWSTPAPIISGAALSALQLNATASVPGTFVYTPALGAVLGLGSQTLQVLFTPTDTTNYTTATASVTLTVNPGYGIWIADGNGYVSGLTQSGAAITTGHIAGGGRGIAVDALGDVWSLNAAAGTIAEFTKAGSLIFSAFNGGGLSSPTALAFDGSGVLWIANANNTVSAFTGAGIPVSATPYSVSIPAPTSIDVDGSGNLWITNAGDNSVTEMIGVATPVVTPIAAAVKSGTLAAKP